MCNGKIVSCLLVFLGKPSEFSQIYLYSGMVEKKIGKRKLRLRSQSQLDPQQRQNEKCLTWNNFFNLCQIYFTSASMWTKRTGVTWGDNT